MASVRLAFRHLVAQHSMLCESPNPAPRSMMVNVLQTGSEDQLGNATPFGCADPVPISKTGRYSA